MGGKIHLLPHLETGGKEEPLKYCSKEKSWFPQTVAPEDRPKPVQHRLIQEKEMETGDILHPMTKVHPLEKVAIYIFLKIIHFPSQEEVEVGRGQYHGTLEELREALRAEGMVLITLEPVLQQETVNPQVAAEVAVELGGIRVLEETVEHI